MNEQWEDFANWLVLDKDTRERLNLPKSISEYSIAHKINDRTLRRWKTDPVFQALVEKKQAKANNKQGITAISANGTPAELEVDPETPEDEYQVIKATLVKGAISGDPKYLDLYFKTYGKEFVAEEAAARTSDLASLDITDLVLEAAMAVDAETVIAYLESIGYRVERGSDDR